MPQLDLYIICNMLYSVIVLGVLTYMLNIQSILIIINLLLRLRKLKVFLEKKYIFRSLKYILKLKKIIIYKLYCYLLSNQLIFAKKFLLTENFEDIRNLKVSDIKFYNFKFYNWLVKFF